MDYGFVFFLHDWNQGYFSNYKFFCFLVSSSEGHVVASSNADCINRYDQLHKSYLLVSFGDFELFCHFECSSYAKGKFCCNSILKCEGKKRRGSGYDNGGEEKEKNCLLTYAWRCYNCYLTYNLLLLFHPWFVTSIDAITVISINTVILNDRS